MKLFKLEDGKLVEAKKEEVANMTNKAIAQSYNAMAAKLDVNLVLRFASKDAAVTRLSKISESYASTLSKPTKTKSTSNGNRVNVEPYPTVDGFVPDATQLVIPKVTKSSPFAGQRIYDATGRDNPRMPTCVETKAPARAWLCFNIIIKAGVVGITFEDYIAAGGNLRDLKHDLKHERVIIK